MDRLRGGTRWILRGVGLAIAVLLILGAGLAWFAGGELCAPVPRTIGPPPASLNAIEVQFPSASGSHIHGWFSRGSPGTGAVLLLHGVRADRRDMLGRAQFLHRLGYSVLLIDFQAHGESPGTLITFGARESEDATAALQYLHSALPAERIGVIGVSLGAAAFVLTEDRPRVDAVILESMYPTIEQAVDDRLRLHLGSWGSRLAPALLWQLKPRLGIDVDRLRPIDRIGRIGAPLLLIQGTRDQHTTLDEAHALFAAASAPKEWWAVEGAAHVDLHRFSGPVYERRIHEFLSTRLATPREHPIG